MVHNSLVIIFRKALEGYESVIHIMYHILHIGVAWMLPHNDLGLGHSSNQQQHLSSSIGDPRTMIPVWIYYSTILGVLHEAWTISDRSSYMKYVLPR